MKRGLYCKASYAVTMAKREIDKRLGCDCNREWLWEALEEYANACPGQLMGWDVADGFVIRALELASE